MLRNRELISSSIPFLDPVFRIVTQNYLKRLRAYLSMAAVILLVSGCHAGGGPVIGYAYYRGIMLGWEAGGGYGPAHFNLGASYRSEESQPRDEKKTSDTYSVGPWATEKTTPKREPGIEEVYYVVFEPWYFAGATLGAGVSTQKGVGFVGGLWGGWAFTDPWGASGAADSTECDEDSPDDRLFLSGAVGVRYMVGAWEVYLTPKVGFFRCVDWPE